MLIPFLPEIAVGVGEAASAAWEVAALQLPRLFGYQALRTAGGEALEGAATTEMRGFGLQSQYGAGLAGRTGQVASGVPFNPLFTGEAATIGGYDAGFVGGAELATEAEVEAAEAADVFIDANEAAEATDTGAGVFSWGNPTPAREGLQNLRYARGAFADRTEAEMARMTEEAIARQVTREAEDEVIIVGRGQNYPGLAGPNRTGPGRMWIEGTRPRATANDPLIQEFGRRQRPIRVHTGWRQSVRDGINRVNRNPKNALHPGAAALFAGVYHDATNGSLDVVPDPTPDLHRDDMPTGRTSGNKNQTIETQVESATGVEALDDEIDMLREQLGYGDEPMQIHSNHVQSTELADFYASNEARDNQTQLAADVAGLRAAVEEERQGMLDANDPFQTQLAADVAGLRAAAVEERQGMIAANANPRASFYMGHGIVRREDLTGHHSAATWGDLAAADERLYQYSSPDVEDRWMPNINATSDFDSNNPNAQPTSLAGYYQRRQWLLQQQRVAHQLEQQHPNGAFTGHEAWVGATEEDVFGADEEEASLTPAHAPLIRNADMPTRQRVALHRAVVASGYASHDKSTLSGEINWEVMRDVWQYLKRR